MILKIFIIIISNDIFVKEKKIFSNRIVFDKYPNILFR